MGRLALGLRDEVGLVHVERNDRARLGGLDERTMVDHAQVALKPDDGRRLRRGRALLGHLRIVPVRSSCRPSDHVDSVSGQITEVGQAIA